jgi:SAM-dependent methyltransferase
MSRRLTPWRVARAVARRVPRGPIRFLMPRWAWRPLFGFWLSVVRSDPDRKRAVRELLTSYDRVYRELDLAAIAYDDGVHPKHRLTRYHDFFVARVRPGETVLDIGCGKGELAYDLVVRGGATVVGVDYDANHLAFARDNFIHERLEFRTGDVLAGVPAGFFDVIVLSNVLEHLAPRVAFLRGIVESARPSRLLLRVPLYERDWTIPLKAEVGLPSYWDPDHEIEYDEQLFRVELGEAGLDVSELVLNWGEIWAVAVPPDPGR